MKLAVLFLSIAAAALAQALTVNTPVGAINCLNQQITWTGGTPPYTIQIQPGGDTTAAALETFTNIAGTSYSWFVTEAANTQVFVRLRDSTGTTAESGTFTIRAGGTCTSTPAAPAPGSTSSTSAAAGGTTTTPAATTPAATTPAGTTPAASGGTTATAGGTTTAAGAGASTSSRPSGARENAKMAVGVVGVVVGVVALLA